MWLCLQSFEHRFSFYRGFLRIHLFKNNLSRGWRNTESGSREVCWRKSSVTLTPLHRQKHEQGYLCHFGLNFQWKKPTNHKILHEENVFVRRPSDNDGLLSLPRVIKCSVQFFSSVLWHHEAFDWSLCILFKRVNRLRAEWVFAFLKIDAVVEIAVFCMRSFWGVWFLDLQLERKDCRHSVLLKKQETNRWQW